MRQTFFSIIICFVSSALSLAQPTCSVRTFTIRDGLPANNITTMAQGPEGLMWIATWNGLCCYDGYQFTTFRGEEWGTEHALSSQRIADIKPDSRGNIWLRTYDKGLYLLDSHQCRYFNVGLLLERKYGKTIVPRNFYVLANGHTWITDEQGRMNLRVDDQYPTDVERMEVWGTLGSKLNGSIVHKVELDQQGQEWITTERGKSCYGSNQLIPLVPEQDNVDNIIRLKDRYGTQWQLTHEGLLSYYDSLNRQLTFCQQVGSVEKWMEDWQHNLWFSSPRGLTQIIFHNRHMQHHTIVRESQTRAVAARHNGTILAGTKNGYICVFDADGRQVGWLNSQGQFNTVPTRFADQIYCIREDSHNNLWIGTKGLGLFVVWAKGGPVSHYSPDSGDAYALSHQNIYDIDEDDQGNIWIGSYDGGLNLVRKGYGEQRDRKLHFIHAGNELKNYPIRDFSRVRRIAHTSEGVILLSCTHGLVTFSNKTDNPQFYTTLHNQTDTTSLRTNDVMQTLVTSNDQVYVVTLGGTIQHITSHELLNNNLRLESMVEIEKGTGGALSLVEAADGHIWVIRETEINRYDVRKKLLEPFAPIGLNQPEFTEAKPCIDNKGRLWTATVGGVLTSNTHQMKKSQYRPNIIFTTLLYQGEQEPTAILHKKILTIPKDKRNLTISFAALDYNDNYLMQYAYRIKGSNENWNYLGRMTSIAFSQLSAGRHCLVVRSTNSDGVWVDNNTELIIDVQPTLWERTWVQVVSLLLVIALSTWGVITFLRFRQRNRQREQRLRNIMRQYRELQEQLEGRQVEQATAEEPREYKLEEPRIVNEDDEMMNSLMQFIEQRISDENLKIEDMADAVGMGRTVFYGKIKELVGVSPSEFLRQVRMQRAQQLVGKSRLTFSEIAYSVGFTDPKYFTKCFKKQTGMTPSDFREKTSAALLR